MPDQSELRPHPDCAGPHMSSRRLRASLEEPQDSAELSSLELKLWSSRVECGRQCAIIQ